VVDFARRHSVVVIHDAAYAALVFEGKPLSFLATPGAKEVGMELHSASKSFNMTGWRCGFVAGNELLVKAYGDVKDNTDSGQFLAIQHAAAYSFDHPEITEKIAAKYSRRMEGLVTVLRQAGFDARKPRGSFFLYVPAPKAATPKNGRAHRIPQRGGGFAVVDYRENDLDGAVGRRLREPAVQRDFRRGERVG
jgi:LL-diaminopimelate aminotransferase